MAFAERTFGGVDILVNNAGIQYVAPVQEFPTERWDAIIAINLSSVFHTTRLALPGMPRAAGADRQHRLDPRPGRLGREERLRRRQAWRARPDQECGAGNGAHAGDLQRHLPRLVLTPLVQKQIDARTAEGVSPEQAEHDLLAEKQPSLAFVTPEQLGGLTLFLCSEAADQGAARPGTWMAAGWRSSRGGQPLRPSP